MDKFISLVKNTITRDGTERFLNWLDTTDFYTAPASSRYHHSYKGGLVDHSIEVYEELLKIAPTASGIVALLHDVCKIGYYAVEKRNRKVDGQWESYDFYVIKDKYPFGHGEKSVDMARNFFKLSAEERMAIRWHMGGFDKDQQGVSNAFKMFPLCIDLHYADLKSSNKNEKEKDMKFEHKVEGYTPDEGKSYEVIPEGRYEVEITGVEDKPNYFDESDTDCVLTYKLENGRLLWDNLTLLNHDSSRVKKAEDKLHNICLACGLSSIEDTSVLLDMKMAIDVVVWTNKQGVEKNLVNAYYPTANPDMAATDENMPF